MAPYRVVLVQPPVEDFYDTEIRLQPIGLAYLKTAIQTELSDVETVILDFHAGWSRRTVGLPRELSYLREFYKVPDESPFCSFYHYFRFGATNEEMVQKILEQKPDIIGISSLFSPYYREVQSLVSAIRLSDQNTPIVLGGSHVSACPELMLSQEGVDFVITGEGELPFIHLIQCLRNEEPVDNIPQLGFKKNGTLILNPSLENLDLNRYPIPDLTDLDPWTYSFRGQPACFIITSRSCPHRCTFCSVHTTFGTSYRRRTVDSVLQEIRMRVSEGYRVIDFEDDNLSFYQTEFREILESIIQEYGERKLTLLAMNGISYISLNAELLQLMYRAGFTNLNLALVSSDKSVREATKRPHTQKKFIEIVETGAALGFEIVAYQILGLPEESLDSMIQTLAFLAGLPVQIGVSLFYLTPASPIARKFPERTASDIFLARSTAMAISTKEQRSALFTLFVTARIINFLKSLPLATGFTINDVLMLQGRNKRESLGLELIRELITSQKLLLAERNGSRVVQEQFQFTLFMQVLSSAGLSDYSPSQALSQNFMQKLF